MIRRPPRSRLSSSSAASDVYKRQGNSAQVNNRPDSAFNPQHEYVFMLSEVDPDMHLAVERSLPFAWSAYHARYFMINGRSMPDTLAPNNASWLPTQPYGALVHIRPYDAAVSYTHLRA